MRFLSGEFDLALLKRIFVIGEPRDSEWKSAFSDIGSFDDSCKECAERHIFYRGGVSKSEIKDVSAKEIAAIEREHSLVYPVHIAPFARPNPFLPGAADLTGGILLTYVPCDSKKPLLDHQIILSYARKAARRASEYGAGA